MSRAFDTIRHDRLIHIRTRNFPEWLRTTYEPWNHGWLRGAVQYLTPLLAPPKKIACHLCYSLCIYVEAALRYLYMTNDTTVSSNRQKSSLGYCLCRWCGLCQPQLYLPLSDEEDNTNMSKTLVPYCQWKTEDLHETRDQPISRSVKDNKETWILTGRYWRCNSQKATGFSGIPLDVDTVVATPTNSRSNAPVTVQCYVSLYVPVLTGTWALTRTKSARLDSFHHTQLKHL